MNTILVIGPGYVGGPLASTLADEGYPVLVASRSGKEVSGCRSITMDVSDPESVRSVASGGDGIEIPQIIIHCASSSHGGVDSYRAVYVNGCRNLVESFPGVPLFFTSSTSVYPQTDGETVTEESPANPSSENGRLLREAEELVLSNRGCVLRLSGIYGPGRSIHLKRVLSGEARIESGDPSRFLNQVHRDDIVSAVVHLLKGEPDRVRKEIYNLTDDESLTMRECYEWLADRLEKTLGPETEPNRSGKRAWTHKKVDNAKLRATGWRPGYPSFRDAVVNDPDLVSSIA